MAVVTAVAAAATTSGDVFPHQARMHRARSYTNTLTHTHPEAVTDQRSDRTMVVFVRSIIVIPISVLLILA